MNNIYLIGFMGSGKTSAGRCLAKKLGVPFTDTDAVIEKLSGMTAAEFIRDRGLRAWRAAEDSVLRIVLASSGRVVALGGGIMPTKARKPLFKKSGITIYLECAEREILKRTAKKPGKRPLLEGDSEKAKRAASRLLKRRKPFYARADISIDTSNLTPERTAGDIIRLLKKNEKKDR